MKLSNSICGFLCGTVICLTACLSISSSDSTKENERKPVVLSMTTTPDIPHQVAFCGEMVDLTRYNMREGFERELRSFTYFPSTTMLLIKRANRYFPVIEPILKANGIPDDFKYLAVIESSLDPRATSPAKAVGIWQMMEGTGRQYGLTITPTVDERRHLVKATEAACKYLKEAYKKYGNWATVAASYNAGMGRISSELTKQQADNSFDLWLVEETMRYVYRIMAIKQVFEQPYKYGFVMQAEDLYKPIHCKGVEVSANIQDLAVFAKEHQITYADLKQFNPWLRDRKLLTSGKTFTIDIPNVEEMYYKQPNSYVHNPAWVVQ